LSLSSIATTLAFASRFADGPRVSVPQGKVERLKREGLSLRAIARQIGVSKTTILRAM
jgi:Helix-turn-helix domain